MIRLSYSILSAWANGFYDQAINSYLHLSMEKTPEMIAGIQMHQAWEREAKQTGNLPVIFGGRKLDSPLFEKDAKKERQINDWLLLVGVPDVLESTNGVEYKYSGSPSNEWSGKQQHLVMQILYPQLKTYEFYCQDPYTREVTMSLVHLNKESLKEGLTWLLTHAKKFKQYVEENNIRKV